MDRTFAATVAAAVVLLAVGVGLGVLVGGFGPLTESQRVDPALTQFAATGGTCVARPTNDVSVTPYSSEEGSSLLVERNVTVPDTSYTLNASFERVGLANYTLAVSAVDTAKPARDCPDGSVPRAHFTATVLVPHVGNETYGVTIVYDGDPLAVVRNGPGGLTVREANGSQATVRPIATRRERPVPPASA